MFKKFGFLARSDRAAGSRSPPKAAKDRPPRISRRHSPFDIGLPLLYAGLEFVVHAVVHQGQDDKGLADDTRNYQMARAADLARSPRHAAPAVPEVVVDTARDDCGAGPFCVLEQIH
jgi:hypothetical protein